MMRFFKYQGAGNDFLIADNRDASFRVADGYLYLLNGETYSISGLCDRRYGVGADGLMLLCAGENCDFRMEYYNSDGSGGMMCGNGGRCIVAFADELLRKPGRKYEFEAADGFHVAEVLSGDKDSKSVRLQMTDVENVQEFSVLGSLEGVDFSTAGYFLNTGTRHFVQLVRDEAEFEDIVRRGRLIRYADEFAPEGVNVNFVLPDKDGIMVRTYEKGVEDETYACGTGIVASAIVASGIICPEKTHVTIDVQAKRDRLKVEFVRSGQRYRQIYLNGPACYVAEIIVGDRK